MAQELDHEQRGERLSRSRGTDSHPAVPTNLQVLERLGTGGFGSVYVVRERSTGRDLALKCLERIDSESIYRFKQEFRLLKECSHPQLVRLHELYCEEGRWSFTMDLIRGVDFCTWVNGASAGKSSRELTETTGDTGIEGEPEPEAPPFEAAAVDIVGESFSEERLREALQQLVAGVIELHTQGIIHRDLKPSNVLVRRDGRLFLLDFGIALVAQPGASFLPSDSRRDGERLGTPAYMSPEQARGVPLSMASDWYAVGVMLYEALTGQLPFIGTRADMLRARMNRDVRDPRTLRSGLPEDLCRLCLELLKRDPFERPSGFNIGVRVGLRPSIAISPRTLEGGSLVGRELEQGKLREAFEKSRTGQTIVAHVHGESGLGKTAIVERFAAQLSMNGEAIVFRGRCFEKASVPFKALDDLVDDISRHLATLPELEAAGLMPRDMRALIRVFPSLGRLSVAKERGGRAPSTDLLELRRRAMIALRELLARLSDVRPLMLFLDDVHWGDGDSAELIRELLGSQDSPRMLLVAVYWSSPGADSELLRTLRGTEREEMGWTNVQIPVQPLGAEEAVKLAQDLLCASEIAQDLARLIAEESEGSPLFIAELVRAHRAMKRSTERVSLNQVFHDRILSLPEDARRVLAVLSASERGLSENDVSQVCALRPEVASRLLETLREERLVTVVNTNHRHHYTVGHQKVRIAVSSAVSVNRMREHHEALANFCESSGQDPEVVAHHYLVAGDRNSAFLFSEKAGDAAIKRSALASALEKYEQALALAPKPARLRILEKLAPTLGRAGVGPAAAQTYLQIASFSKTPQEYVRKAGEQYLLAGMTADAKLALRPILDVFNLRVPRGRLFAAMSLYYQRWRLFSRLKKARRDLEQDKAQKSSADTLTAVDLSWTLANGFAGIDVFLSVHYTGVSLWRALDTGEPERIARALSLYSILRALENQAGQRVALPALEYADYFAERSGSSHAKGWVMGGRAILSLSTGDLVACEEQGREALDLLRDCQSLSFREIGTLSVWFWLYPSYLLGKLQQFGKEAPAIAREAEARGDLYTLSTTRTYVLPLHFLLQDRPGSARKIADDGLRAWADDEWQNQHWAHLYSHCVIDLYEGRGEDILERIRLGEPRMKAAFQLMIQAIRIDLLYLEGRGLLVSLARGNQKQRHPSRARQVVTLLRREASGLAPLYADVLDAGLRVYDDKAQTLEAFHRLRDAFSARSMVLHAAGAAFRAAQLSEAATASEDAGNALAVLEQRGVSAPSRFVDLLMPQVILELS